MFRRRRPGSSEILLQGFITRPENILKHLLTTSINAIYFKSIPVFRPFIWASIWLMSICLGWGAEDGVCVGKTSRVTLHKCGFVRSAVNPQWGSRQGREAKANAHTPPDSQITVQNCTLYMIIRVWCHFLIHRSGPSIKTALLSNAITPIGHVTTVICRRPKPRSAFKHTCIEAVREVGVQNLMISFSF